MATMSLGPAPMRVAQIPKPGADFQMVDRAVPNPARGEVRVKVRACGVCHSDVLTKRRPMARNSISSRPRTRSRGHHR